jgi:hypothetical protein
VRDRRRHGGPLAWKGRGHHAHELWASARSQDRRSLGWAGLGWAQGLPLGCGTTPGLGRVKQELGREEPRRRAQGVQRPGRRTHPRTSWTLGCTQVARRFRRFQPGLWHHEIWLLIDPPYTALAGYPTCTPHLLRCLNPQMPEKPPPAPRAVTPGADTNLPLRNLVPSTGGDTGGTEAPPAWPAPPDSRPVLVGATVLS